MLHEDPDTAADRPRLTAPPGITLGCQCGDSQGGMISLLLTTVRAAPRGEANSASIRLPPVQHRVAAAWLAAAHAPSDAPHAAHASH
jgi:hypothetical protein